MPVLKTSRPDRRHDRRLRRRCRECLWFAVVKHLGARAVNWCSEWDRRVDATQPAPPACFHKVK